MIHSLELPRIYEDPFGNYPQHKNKYKLSYSQYNSWSDPLYKEQYIRSYFMGLKDPGNRFASFGSACGGYFEDLTIDDEWLSPTDIKHLKKLDRPETARYEVEVVIDRSWYVIQGFIDQEILVAPKRIWLQDLKTGNMIKKEAYYAGPDYQQTTLYCYQREKEGFEIEYSGVILLGRRGTGYQNSPLYLTGEIKSIVTPYSGERAEQFLQKMDMVAEDIAGAFALYKKLIAL